jgi:hypothetical protein
MMKKNGLLNGVGYGPTALDQFVWFSTSKVGEDQGGSEEVGETL